MFKNWTKKLTQETHDNDYTAEFDVMDIEKNKTIACFSYILFFIVFFKTPVSPFAKFHAKQSLSLLLVSVAERILVGALRLIASLFFFIPYLTNVLLIIISFINMIISLLLLCIFIYGMSNALSGKAKKLPVIGFFARYFNF